MLPKSTKRRTGKGFTLIEVVVTIVLVAIIFSIGGMLLGRAFETYDATQATTFVDSQGRLALERMTRELRHIRSTADLTIATSTSPIFFRVIDGSAVCYCHESASATVRRGTSLSPTCGTGGVAPTASCGTGGTQPMADNVPANGLNFNYYTATGGTAATGTQVYDIAISLQMSKGVINETYRTSVQPRAF